MGRHLRARRSSLRDTTALVPAALVVAGALGVAMSYLTGRADEAWWHAATAGAAIAVYVAALVPRLRDLLPWLALAWLSLLVLTTLATGAGLVSVQGWHWGLTGVSIWYANPNLLGGALAALCVTCLVLLGGRYPWLAAALLLATLSAVLFAGARSGLLALVVGTLAWLLTERRARLPVTLAALVAASLVTLAWTASAPPPGPNLLTSSHAFQRSHWVKGAGVRVMPTWNAGRDAPEAGVRVVREGGVDGTALLRQTVAEVPEDAALLVGSIYARADAPTAFELTLGRSTVTCEASTVWTRCVTPPADTQRTSLAVRASEPGAPLDLHLWGAQVEVGDAAGPIAVRRPPAIPLPQVAGLRPERIFGGGDAGRSEARALAAHLVAERPIDGHGIAGAAIAMRELGGRQYGHAHFGPLQVLLEHGMLVSAAWLVAIGTAVTLALRRSGVRTLPFIAALAALNAFDAMVFVDAPYLTSWLVAAYGASAPRGRLPVAPTTTANEVRSC